MTIFKKKKYFIFVTWLAFLSLSIYFGVRVYVYILASQGTANNIFAALLILAEGHSVLHSLGYLYGIMRLKKNKKYFKRQEIDKNNPPLVTILVPGRNEPIHVLETTFISLSSLNYKNKKIVFLDGSDDEFSKKNQALAKKYKINRFAPTEIPRSKAAIVNQYLSKIDSEYLVIFDADQNPMPEFLNSIVPLIEKSKNIAYVQTPQLYSNLGVSPIAKGAAMQQSIFFESICEAKGNDNSMFCCGTNFIMRTKALREVGGFDENSVTEDFSTSIKIHSLGYRSIYYNHVRAFGMAPESLPTYFKQQFRWASGTLGAVRSIIILAIHRKLNLHFVQLWEYLLSGTYYLAGWSFLILMLAPSLFLLFNIPTYFSNPYFYIFSFLPYYILTFFTFYATMKERHYHFRDIFTGMTINYINFPILIKASIAALLNIKLKFQITTKGKSESVPLIKLWPWILMIIINTSAIISGFLRLSENPYAMIINIIWCTYHLIILMQIFKLNRKPDIKKLNILNYTKI
jgi:cellulose synthase (UDP-forming)